MAVAGERSHRVAPEAARAIGEDADVVLVESEFCAAVLGPQPREVRGWIEGKAICVLVTPFALDSPLADYRASNWGCMCAAAGRGQPSRC